MNWRMKEGNQIMYKSEFTTYVKAKWSGMMNLFIIKAKTPIHKHDINNNAKIKKQKELMTGIFKTER